MTNAESDARAWVQPTPANWPIVPDPPPPSAPETWLDKLSYLILIPLALYAAFSYLMEYGRETVPWDYGDPNSMGYWGHGMTEEQRIESARQWRERMAK